MNRKLLFGRRTKEIFMGFCLLLFLMTSLPLTAYPYKIKQGDTLYSLSRKFNVSVKFIKSTNNIKGDFIREGSVIEIPSNVISYKVVKGDTLYRLAVRTGSTVDEILALNDKPRGYLLKSGSTILLKKNPGYTTNTKKAVPQNTSTKNSLTIKEKTPDSQTASVIIPKPVIPKETVISQNNENSNATDKLHTEVLKMETRDTFQKKYPNKSSSTGPSNILLVGDSLAYGSQYSFADKFSSPSYNFESKGVSASGLVCDSFFDWVSESARLSKKEKWDSVIIMLGANDGQAFSRNGREIPLFSNEWNRLYKEEAKKIIRAFSENGTDVYWLSIPPMYIADYNGRMVQLNNLIKEICREENIEFIDLGTVIGDTNGNYSNAKMIKGQWQNVRTDGIHYSPAGSGLISEEMYRIIEKKN